MSDQTRDPWKNMTRYVPRHGDQCVSSDDGLLVLVEDVDVARAADAQTIATLQDENARLKAGRDSAEDELDTLKRQRDKAYADSAGLLLERNALRDENARLKAERDDAASWADLVTRGKGLCGHWKCYTYTEDPKGVRLDCLQCRAERVEAELATLKADAARREREALSHEDACVISRIFNQYQLIQIDQYERINEFLKSLIESAFLTQRQEQSRNHD